MATGLLNLLGTLSDATTTPQVNPLYGAQYLTPDDHPKIPKAGWYDANGNDVSDKMAAIPTEQHGIVTQQPYVQPGFWGKLGSTGRAISMANAEGEASQGRMLNTALNTRGTAEALDPTLTNNLYAQTYDNRFGPANRGLVARAQAYNDTGAPTTLGGNEGQSDILQSQINLQNAKAGLNRNPIQNAALDQQTVNNLHTATNLDPLIIQHNINQLKGELGRDPTEQEILSRLQDTRNIQSKAENTAAPSNARTLIGQSALAAGRTQAEQDLFPYEVAENRAQHTANLYQLEHPTISQPSVFNASVNPEDMTITPGILPFKQSLLGQMTSNMGSPSTGNAVNIGGKSVNVPSDEELGGEANTVDPLHQHAIDLHEAKGDAEQADLKAKKAAIDAESKQRKLNHLVGKTALFEQEHPHGTGYIVGKTAGDTLSQMWNSPLNLANDTYKGFKLLGHAISGE